MTTIKHGTVDLPAYWASALVNNDWSGVEGTSTETKCRAWSEANPLLCIEGCNNESFISRYDDLLCDMLTYSYTERVN
jgi:hypothetical protein